MQFERRKEKRQACNLQVEVFLSQGMEGPEITPHLTAQLVSLTRQGADVALDEIMHESTHLALTPMGSDILLFNIILPADNEENSLTVPAIPVWFDKKTGTGMPPFRIGLKFTEHLSFKQFQQINKGVS